MVSQKLGQGVVGGGWVEGGTLMWLEAGQGKPDRTGGAVQLEWDHIVPHRKEGGLPAQAVTPQPPPLPSPCEPGRRRRCWHHPYDT